MSRHPELSDLEYELEADEQLMAGESEEGEEGELEADQIENAELEFDELAGGEGEYEDEYEVDDEFSHEHGGKEDEAGGAPVLRAVAAGVRVRVRDGP